MGTTTVSLQRRLCTERKRWHPTVLFVISICQNCIANSSLFLAYNPLFRDWCLLKVMAVKECLFLDCSFGCKSWVIITTALVSLSKLNMFPTCFLEVLLHGTGRKCTLTPHLKSAGSCPWDWKRGQHLIDRLQFGILEKLSLYPVVTSRGEAEDLVLWRDETCTWAEWWKNSAWASRELHHDRKQCSGHCLAVN